ncbi:RF-1 domain containing protein, putative [Trypanosoma equiperdum]|uniref:Prokaryotic-type class I peptide chain release factors domain-containing protein n=3 Tax=Trypanozoon TaxID=39700 RepID=Q584Q6_TRYB2|nr:hypothetical protein, conserved [Trypanosoma brucei gambiense DAL972]XP_845371.1 hypothetical protein, conserved [Trypanosoma brucei brucei TREU927]AAX80882.1 hypothetical protein, conserved [Trypanosoma brucei]SCU71881.1 RF-1 domain containing protein, putative [Trypanosoma equiperdum]AAZ11812.1 hypothetical protein, conserved [Trypanosoma brucei brucei TREU927]CBH11748.1 hypothetical protein, conserved [Trypanosoma brucei gambiense DAL972]|eukprot:XP_011774033.1 hypothetical protein, conserved [Trypanosoma brucei gambiense DAL972]
MSWLTPSGSSYFLSKVVVNSAPCAPLHLLVMHRCRVAFPCVNYRPLLWRGMLQVPSRPTICDNSLKVQLRHSRISSFKQEGYYRFARAKDIHVDESCFTLLTARGGGPGGQGSNSSSNKVEMRVNMASLSEYFDEELIGNIKANECGKALTSDETQLIISSHEHRSMYQNKEECIRRLQQMIHVASWVPPVEANPIKKPSHIVSERKNERRKKSAVKKMRQTARKGLW